MHNHIKQIQKEQTTDGSFQDLKGSPSFIRTSVMLSLLASSSVSSKELEAIKKGAVRFLLSRKNSDWEFKEPVEEKFYALSAIAEYDKEIIDGKAIAKILQSLITLESKEGGPYYSDNFSRGKSIDPLTNACIGRFLSFLGADLPNLEPFRNMLTPENKIIKAFHLAPTPGLSSALSLARVSSLVPNEKENRKEKEMIDTILKSAQKRFKGLSPEFRNFAMQSIQKTMRGNRDKQMPLMSYYMKEALGEKARKISDEMIAEMGLANIFFWTAFIIYDDFWDEDESADPRILPSANLYARSYVDFFSSLLPEPTGFRHFFRTLMDELDGANTWETLHCRTTVQGSIFTIPKELPDYAHYEKKYRPASGHILGPVAILLFLGYTLDSSEVKNLISYFKNYLIAMQLNDDAHDWEEDMARGHVSTVVALLLSDLKKAGWKKQTIDMVADMPEVKKIFWFTTIKKYSELTRIYAKRSRKALSSIQIFDNTYPLVKLIDNTENAALQAEREREKTSAFLRTYTA